MEEVQEGIAEGKSIDNDAQLREGFVDVRSPADNLKLKCERDQPAKDANNCLAKIQSLLGNFVKPQHHTVPCREKVAGETVVPANVAYREEAWSPASKLYSKMKRELKEKFAREEIDNNTAKKPKIDSEPTYPTVLRFEDLIVDHMAKENLRGERKYPNLMYPRENPKIVQGGTEEPLKTIWFRSWNTPPWEYDLYLVLFQRLLTNERKARHFERTLNEVIQQFVVDKHEFLEKHGVNERPHDANTKGHHVRYPLMWPATAVQVMNLSEDDRFFHVFSRIVFLFRFFSVAENDLKRLWYKSHDGRSDRYFQLPKLVPDPNYGPVKPSKGWPWYLGNGTDTWWRLASNWRQQRMHEDECRFCVAFRMLVEIENEFFRLLVFLERLPNSNVMPNEVARIALATKTREEVGKIAEHSDAPVDTSGPLLRKHSSDILAQGSQVTKKEKDISTAKETTSQLEKEITEGGVALVKVQEETDCMAEILANDAITAESSKVEAESESGHKAKDTDCHEHSSILVPVKHGCCTAKPVLVKSRKPRGPLWCELQDN